MANTTPVNGQITDAVTQANVKVLGDAPAQALGTLYQVMSQSVGLSMQNAVSLQQSRNTINTAVTTQGVNLLYSMDVAADAVATKDIFNANSMAGLVMVLKALTGK
ncbi:RebB like protein [Skermanella stibiiresistens SB22]|uniref:RebB like protein n=1 Tax=Skermanella stibiiresistens SB22 TaxID=1385369 RepID=W9GWW7_9PROT|nr:RebB family R body protein [Skermanella stibiiresistens]EWY38405.1 RebB like protein [Skermanella stibiiresistens SB22]